MKLQLIYKRGHVLNERRYDELRELDARVFYECGNEFLTNRDWWVAVEEDQIVAYCGCLYSSDDICIFVRAWVQRNYRGWGMQKRMINARLKAARVSCVAAITYTTYDNVHSANNLIRCKFLLYEPQYAYAGRDKLYFKRLL